MGTVKDIKEKAYCDEVLSELAYMIESVDGLRDMLMSTYDKDTHLFHEHDRHLKELAEYLDWKLQILTTSCPFEWKGLGPSVENIVSVEGPGVAPPEFSGGYLGG